MTLEIVALLITFSGVVLGVFGKSWDVQQKGCRRLRPSGYAALSIALVGLVISGVQVLRKATAADLERNQTRTMRAIGIVKLQAAIDRLYGPIIAMRSSYDGSRYYYYPADQFDLPMQVMSDRGFKTWLQKQDLFSEAQFGPDRKGAGYSWGELVTRDVADASESIDRTLAVYGAKLPVQVVVQAELLRNSAIFSQSTNLQKNERALTAAHFLSRSLFESETLPAMSKLSNLLRVNYEEKLFGPSLGLLVIGKFTKADESYRAAGGSLTELPTLDTRK